MSWLNWFVSPKVDTSNDSTQTEDCNDLELLDLPELAQAVLDALNDRVEELESQLETVTLQRDSAEMLVVELRDELVDERNHSDVLSKELKDISSFWNTKREAIDSVLRAKDISITTMETEDIIDEIDDDILPPFPEMTTLDDIGVDEDWPKERDQLVTDLVDEMPSPWDLDKE